MSLDEALAVYEFLKNRAPGDRSYTEERAYVEAWDVICSHADKAIHRSRNR